MKKLLVLGFLFVLCFGACDWFVGEETPDSITIVILSLDELLNELWWPDQIYMKGDVVRDDMLWYESLQNNNIGHKPDISTEWWESYEKDTGEMP